MRVLSLGWGVQSFTLAAMAALGEIQKPDLVVHADTTWEREATYAFAKRWVPWLAEHGIEVITTQSHRARPMVHQSKTSPLRYVLLPAMTAGGGMLKRQCTNEWKIAPITKLVNARKVKGTHVFKVLGISLDEWQRMRVAKEPNTTHVYPLVDMGMRRMDCIRWLQSNGLEVPGKSSCVMCPYHDRATWEAMKQENGSDWRQACEWDETIRHLTKKDGVRDAPIYLHRACKPLEQAVNDPQPTLFDEAVCEGGYCFQ